MNVHPVLNLDFTLKECAKVKNYKIQSITNKVRIYDFELLTSPSVIRYLLLLIHTLPTVLLSSSFITHLHSNNSLTVLIRVIRVSIRVIRALNLYFHVRLPSLQQIFFYCFKRLRCHYFFIGLHGSLSQSKKMVAHFINGVGLCFYNCYTYWLYLFLADLPAPMDVDLCFIISYWL